jgi:hypothetical protein
MQNKDTRDLAVPPELWWNGHVQLRWIDVGEFPEAERRLMAVHSLGLFAPIPGPERPDCEVRMVRLGKAGEAVNAAVLTDPVPCLNMVWMSVFRKPRSFRLLGREEALLRLCILVEALERIFARLPHDTIL